MIRPLLIIRPEPGNAETAARARAFELDTRCIPLFEVRPVPWSPPDPAPYVGVLLTSASALRTAGPELARYLHLPAFAVGGTTARLARDAGFHSVVVGESDVTRLMGKIATLGLHRLLHFCGKDVRSFDPYGIVIDRCIVYASEAIEPPETFRSALAEGPVAMVHSPLAAARLAELVEPESRAHIALVAISANAAEGAGQGWEVVAIASQPRDEAILEAAARLYR